MESDSREALSNGASAADESANPETDPFEGINFDRFFDDYLDPGFRSPSAESVEKASFETFLSSPVTLSDRLQSQLSVLIVPEQVRKAASNIIGKLEESGYLIMPLQEIASAEGLRLETLRPA